MPERHNLGAVFCCPLPSSTSPLASGSHHTVEDRVRADKAEAIGILVRNSEEQRNRNWEGVLGDNTKAYLFADGNDSAVVEKLIMYGRGGNCWTRVLEKMGGL